MLAVIGVDAGDDGVVGQEGRQVRLDADRAHAGAAAAVRDAEGLVQVHVADVGTQLGGAGDADQGVEVGAVEIDLAAMGVDQGADVLDRGLEHAVGAGVGDHQGGEAVLVLLGLGLEVGEVDIAVRVAADDHHAHAGHDRAGGVGAVGGGGDQADVAGLVVAAVVPGADGEQAGIFALAAGVGLERDGVEAGDLLEPGLEVAEQGLVAGGLVLRREGVEVGELGPGDRDHLGGGVELHGAGAERDHRPVEGDVLGLEAAQVAQHLGLAAVERWNTGWVRKGEVRARSVAMKASS